MKILHYTLGLPPYRTGGLTKYSIDLMKSQVETKDDVFLLYPSYFSFSKKTSIKFYSTYNGIKVFELINPLPISLLSGISTPEYFMKSVDSAIYKKFLNELQPDIIHIHTLMGMHKELLIAAKELNIRVVYTTHDYFGICSKVNLIDYNNEICTDYNKGVKCVVCNEHAFSLPLIFLMQSKIYQNFKDNNITKSLRKNIKNIRNKGNSNIKHKESENKKELSQEINKDITNEYIRLRDFYLEMLNSIDYFHFNSYTAKIIYQKYLNLSGEVIPLTHNDIIDNRRIKAYDEESQLKMTFLGPLDKYKGFPLLKEALNKLIDKNILNWHLNVYGNSNEVFLNQIEQEKITLHGRYNHNQLESIFNNTDVLLVPSIWKETFGFIALEALSFGIPILVSEHVGVQDVIKHLETGLIVKSNSNELSNILEQLTSNREMLRNINKNICLQEFLFLINEHNTQINNLYKKVIGVN